MTETLLFIGGAILGVVGAFAYIVWYLLENWGPDK